MNNEEKVQTEVNTDSMETLLEGAELVTLDEAGE